MSPSWLLLIAGIVALSTTLLIFWPPSGFYWTFQRQRLRGRRFQVEDALKFIHQEEIYGRPPNRIEIAGALNLNEKQSVELLTEMAAAGLVDLTDIRISLTANGREAALHIIRAHRLWEHHLAQETGYAEVEWHSQADQMEHYLTTEDLDALSRRLNYPAFDPHGDPIPTSAGEVLPHGGQTLNTLPLDRPARIVHLEDEPEIVYAQLAAEGLHPGQIVRLVESTSTRVRFWANGDEHTLAPIVAANISVNLLPAVAPPVEIPETFKLAALAPGESARVVSLSPRCRGAEKRRLLDLGIVKDTIITAEFGSPSGDPVAYTIRGALIALRQEQAALVNVGLMEEAASPAQVKI